MTKKELPTALLDALAEHRHVKTVWVNKKGEWHFTETKGFEAVDVSDIKHKEKED